MGSLISVNYSQAQIIIQASPSVLEEVRITYVVPGETLVYGDLYVPYVSEEFGVEVRDLNEIL